MLQEIQWVCCGSWEGKRADLFKNNITKTEIQFVYIVSNYYSPYIIDINYPDERGGKSDCLDNMK